MDTQCQGDTDAAVQPAEEQVKFSLRYFPAYGLTLDRLHLMKWKKFALSLPGHHPTL